LEPTGGGESGFSGFGFFFFPGVFFGVLLRTGFFNFWFVGVIFVAHRWEKKKAPWFPPNQRNQRLVTFFFGKPPLVFGVPKKKFLGNCFFLVLGFQPLWGGKLLSAMVFKFFFYCRLAKGGRGKPYVLGLGPFEPKPSFSFLTLFPKPTGRAFFTQKKPQSPLHKLHTLWGFCLVFFFLGKQTTWNLLWVGGVCFWGWVGGGGGVFWFCVFEPYKNSPYLLVFLFWGFVWVWVGSITKTFG